MQQDIAIERLFQSLIAGDRNGARELVSEYLASGNRSEDLAIDVLWPSMQTLFQMWRNDQLSTLAHRYATRLMRTIVDQAQASYAQAPRNGRRVMELYHKSPGSDFKTARDTWWGAFNAVTRFVDHEMGRDRDVALTSAWFGPRATLKQRARSLAVDMAKVELAS